MIFFGYPPELYDYIVLFIRAIWFFFFFLLCLLCSDNAWLHQEQSSKDRQNQNQNHIYGVSLSVRRLDKSRHAVHPSSPEPNLYGPDSLGRDVSRAKGKYDLDNFCI